MNFELNNIYCIECISAMKTMPDNCVDYVFTSPPYNRKRNDKYAKYNDIIKDYYGFLVSCTDEMLRVCKNHVFINLQTNYYNKVEVYKFMGKYADKIQNTIIWEKSNPMPANGFNITNSYEYFFVLGDKPLKAKHTYTKNIVTTSVNSSMNNSVHKAVMNIEVAEWMFDNFIPEEVTVLDPMMGLGTTAIVAQKHGCDWLGFEIVDEYCNLAYERILDSVFI